MDFLFFADFSDRVTASSNLNNLFNILELVFTEGAKNTTIQAELFILNKIRKNKSVLGKSQNLIGDKTRKRLLELELYYRDES